MNLLPAARRRALSAAFPLLALLLLGGCEKPGIPLVLPEATQDGQDTFGCLLNENVWRTISTNAPDHIREAELSPDGRSLHFRPDNDGIPAHFDLRITDAAGPIRPGTYQLNQGFTAAYSVSREGLTEVYQSGAANQGAVTITTVAPFTKNGSAPGLTIKGAIVAGTFAFTATSAEGKLITVREGRFDVKVYE